MSTNPMPSLGSHLAPTNANNSSFADTHEVHYAPSYNFSTGATVHSQQYDNSAYRPGSRTPISLYGGPGGGPAMSAAAPPPSVAPPPRRCTTINHHRLTTESLMAAVTPPLP